MPLTAKGKEILAQMERTYGETHGKSVFYASANKGTITGVGPDSIADSKKLDSITKHISDWEQCHSLKR